MFSFFLRKIGVVLFCVVAFAAAAPSTTYEHEPVYPVHQTYDHKPAYPVHQTYEHKPAYPVHQTYEHKPAYPAHQTYQHKPTYKHKEYDYVSCNSTLRSLSTERCRLLIRSMLPFDRRLPPTTISTTPSRTTTLTWTLVTTRTVKEITPRDSTSSIFPTVAVKWSATT